MNDVFFNTSTDDVYKPWQLKILDAETFNGLSKRAKLEYLAYFGILAPTTHNTVPQRFRIDEKTFTIELLIDTTFILPESDVTGRQAMTSMGCVIANIELAAAHFGYKTTERVLAKNKATHHKEEKGRYAPVVQLKFSKARPTQPIDLQLIVERKVVRAKFDRTITIPKKILDEVSQYVRSSFPKISLHVITTDDQLHTLGKFHEDAYKIVFEHPGFTYELGEWLLPNSEATLPYGMRGREFGFDDTFAQKVHKGLLRKASLLPDEIAGFARGVRFTIENSSATIIITAPKEDVATLLEVGKAYEMMSLLFQSHGFFNAVNAGIVEVDWAGSIVSASVLGTQEKPYMVFSVGKPERKDDLKRPHSARPMLEDLLV